MLVGSKAAYTTRVGNFLFLIKNGLTPGWLFKLVCFYRFSCLNFFCFLKFNSRYSVDIHFDS